MYKVIWKMHHTESTYRVLSRTPYADRVTVCIKQFGECIMQEVPKEYLVERIILTE